MEMLFTLMGLLYMVAMFSLPILGLVNFVLIFAGSKENTKSHTLKAVAFMGIGTALWVFVIGLGVFLSGHRPATQGQLTACKSNLKNIATALEMYASDNQGRYPDSLSRLTPEYLKKIPNCPAAQSDAYSSSYVRQLYQPDLHLVDEFTVCCKGDHHSKAGTAHNHPVYTSQTGLEP